MYRCAVASPCARRGGFQGARAIPLAAWLVNVTAVTCDGLAPVSSRRTMRSTSVKVLPVPGPGDDRQRPCRRFHGAALLVVEAALEGRDRSLFGGLARPDGGGSGLFRRGGHVEHRHLTAEHFHFTGREEGDDAVFAVVAAFAQHLARAQAADALFQFPSAGGAQIAKRRFAQYVQFASQRGKQLKIAFHDFFGGGGKRPCRRPVPPEAASGSRTVLPLAGGGQPSGRSANNSARCLTPMVSLRPQAGQRPSRRIVSEGSRQTAQARCPSR